MKPFLAPLGAIAFLGAFLALYFNPPQVPGISRPQILLIVWFWALMLAATPMRLGFREVLPNRVCVRRRATWVTPKLAPLELLLPIASGVAALASAVLFIKDAGGPISVLQGGLIGVALGPILAIGGAGLIIANLWQQLRGIKLTPESITYWRGIGRITVAWDELGDAISTNDVRDHEGYRTHLNKYLPGAKIVAPVERVMDVKLRVHWEDADTPRLLLETDHFTVEPSALLTAILALRDNPDLRPLLGTRQSKVLFKGPPWRVRRHMYRTQQWWPKGAAPDGISVGRDGVVKEFQ